MFGRRGRSAGSIFAVGPSITSCQAGRAAARPSIKPRSMRSSITPKKPSRGCGIPDWSTGSRSRLRAVRKWPTSTLLGKAWMFVCWTRFASNRLWPAGEDDVGRLHQLRLAVHEAGRSAAKGRELVHAVVHDRHRVELAREVERHRRVVPEQVARAVAQQHPEQPLECLARGLPGEALGQVRHDHEHALGGDRQPQVRRDARLEDGLLDEVHPLPAREAAHQVMGPLVDEVPAQVRQADEVRLLRLVGRHARGRPGPLLASDESRLCGRGAHGRSSFLQGAAEQTPGERDGFVAADRDERSVPGRTWPITRNTRRSTGSFVRCGDRLSLLPPSAGERFRFQRLAGLTAATGAGTAVALAKGHGPPPPSHAPRRRVVDPPKPRPRCRWTRSPSSCSTGTPRVRRRRPASGGERVRVDARDGGGNRSGR